MVFSRGVTEKVCVYFLVELKEAHPFLVPCLRTGFVTVEKHGNDTNYRYWIAALGQVGGIITPVGCHSCSSFFLSVVTWI